MTDIEARETPPLRVVESTPSHAEPTPVVAPPPSQMLIDAVTQLEANKKDVSPKGFQKRLQLAYAIFDQASLMVQEIESQHARLVTDLMSVERRTPLSGETAANS